MPWRTMGGSNCAGVRFAVRAFVLIAAQLQKRTGITGWACHV